MRQKMYLIVLLFLCTIMTGCDSCKCELTLDKGFGNVETTKYKYEDLVHVPILSDKDDYSFEGWAETKDGEYSFSSMTFEITSDETYYALWKKKCKILFNDLYSKSIDQGYLVSLGYELSLSGITPNIYLEPYFTFKGWSTDGKAENIISTITITEEDITLYAVWEQKIFRIYFDLNGGTGIELPKIEVKKGDYLSYSSLPTSGFSYGVYTFEGWSETKNGKVITSDFKPDKDMTLYAVWSHNGQVKDKTDDN